MTGVSPRERTCSSHDTRAHASPCSPRGIVVEARDVVAQAKSSPNQRSLFGSRSWTLRIFYGDMDISTEDSDELRHKYVLTRGTRKNVLIRINEL